VRSPRPLPIAPCFFPLILVALNAFFSDSKKVERILRVMSLVSPHLPFFHLHFSFERFWLPLFPGSFKDQTFPQARRHCSPPPSPLTSPKSLLPSSLCVPSVVASYRYDPSLALPFLLPLPDAFSFSPSIFCLDAFAFSSVTLLWSR